MVKGDDATPIMMSNKMIVNLDVFSALVENIIMRNVNGTLIFAEESFGVRLQNTKISKKMAEPHNLNSGVTKSPVLGFSTRARNNTLLLALPGNERVSKKDKEPSGRLTISHIPSLIGI